MSPWRQTTAGAGPTLRALGWLALALGATLAAEALREYARVLDGVASRAEERAEPHEARAQEILLT